MKQARLWLGLALLLAVLVIGSIISTRTSADASAFSSKPHNPPPSFQTSDSYVPGNPAISPDVAMANTSNNSSNPAFSIKDVENFLNTYGFYAGPVVNGGHLKIVSIQFVSAKQAGELMHGESVGRPDNYLVCYVKVKGPFSRAHTPGSI